MEDVAYLLVISEALCESQFIGVFDLVESARKLLLLEVRVERNANKFESPDVWIKSEESCEDIEVILIPSVKLFFVVSNFNICHVWGKFEAEIILDASRQVQILYADLL